MFDKLEDLVARLEEVMKQLSDPDVVNDQEKFRSLMKEQNDLTPIVEKYNEYKDAKQTIDDSLEMLEEENDEDMKESDVFTFGNVKVKVWKKKKT